MSNRYILITGGAGFIGTNVARSYLEKDQAVHILDNLGREGVERNVRELQNSYPGRVQFTQADVRDGRKVQSAVDGASAIYHLAAQVAVTTSLEDPIGDVETNLMGTLNVLEAVRRSGSSASVLFTSTNKVYGRLNSIAIGENGRRHEPVEEEIAQNGVSERQPLEFLSPYGCSKGSADQYVLDYAHSFGLRASVFRMSCIYGRYQLGSEDQGWVAHFVRQALKGEPITIFGDGKQVRDLLFVDDLVRAMHLVHENMELAAGQVFNMGGGKQNSTSLLDLIQQLGTLTGSPVAIEWGPERLADQRWFVADTRKIRDVLGWTPQFSIREGLRTLYNWYLSRPSLFEHSAVQVA
ncbi:MAG: SDR family NAD(P)-dependent oxidoreductase [Acidobacteriota bacterium]|nr:SDR family NAD(P)-dependent oxidoreductase [Acidobacteriota bacterium]